MAVFTRLLSRNIKINVAPQPPQYASSIDSHAPTVFAETPQSFASEDRFSSCPVRAAHSLRNLWNVLKLEIFFIGRKSRST